MKKITIISLLGILATLPACDWCCKSTPKDVAPIEIATVQEDIVPADQGGTADMETMETVGDLEVMPEDLASK
jgi:hypothetical protein